MTDGPGSRQAVVGEPVAPVQRRPALASVEDLRISFRTKAGSVRAVDGVSFEILDGETLGLVGETGCGKTVTARSFLRLIPMPPGEHRGGRVLFRRRRRCPACGGVGCPTCDGLGRVPTPCPSCAGAGCPACDGSGQVVMDIMAMPEERLRDIRGNRIAMIFQDPGKALNPALSVKEQIAEVLFAHRSRDLLVRAGVDPSVGGVSALLLRRMAQQRSRRPERLMLRLPPLRSAARKVRRAAEEWVADSLSETRIPDPLKVMRSYPHELSGGMKQRVMIAQALACDPDLLIADEPTTALDVTIQARILDLIRDLQRRHHASVLYISHDLSLVRQICDRVVVMYAGRVVETGTPEALFREPLHPYTRGLLGAIPSAGEERARLVAIDGTVPELVDPSPSCRFHPRCPHAAPACRVIDPALEPHGKADRRVACLLYRTAEEVGSDEARMPTLETRD